MKQIILFAVILSAVWLNSDDDARGGCARAHQFPSAAHSSAGTNVGLRRSASLFMSPLVSDTYQRARNLLGQGLHQASTGSMGEFVHDKFDRLQARTFKVFMQLYNKTYSARELPKRMRLFFKRRAAIEASIKAFAAGKLSFVMRENPYVDWDDQELKALAGVSPPKSAAELSTDERAVIFGQNNNNDSDRRAAVQGQTMIVLGPGLGNEPASGTSGKRSRARRYGPFNVSAPAVNIPTRRDWRQSGCVAAPVNQHKCGCCYAIATMGVVETMRCIRGATSPTLSPQQIVDCATPRAGYQNYGCNGGWPTRVLRYLQDVNVAAREACYPLVLRQNYCKLNRIRTTNGCTVAPSSTNGQKIRYKVLTNEQDILYHVAKTGPVVTVMKTTDKFLYYGSGVFDDPSCTRRADDVDHAISIVGYGRENGHDYWLIKNSWGTEWGLGGYGKFKRGTNACSIGHWGWVILN